MPAFYRTLRCPNAGHDSNHHRPGPPAASPFRSRRLQHPLARERRKKSLRRFFSNKLYGRARFIRCVVIPACFAVAGMLVWMLLHR